MTTINRRLGQSTALITGASRGLGHAVATKLASDGADVLLCARDSTALSRCAREISSRFGTSTAEVAVDLGMPSAADEIYKAAAAFRPRLDTLVCCAGETKGGRLEELSDRDWAESFAPKFFSTMSLIRRLIPLMRGGSNSTIVLLTGSQGFEPKAENIISATVNAALNAAVKSLANDFSKDGIRVIGISPGPFDTDRMRTVIADRSRSLGITLEESIVKSMSQVPMGRFGRPEELAELVAFLTGNSARFLNGLVIAADGGMRRGF